MKEADLIGKKKVLIVGAGLAGLCCARELRNQGISSTILEADTRVGGRVQTVSESGFQLDRGFQVLLSSYPEAQKVLDYDRLQLGYFEPGALIRFQGRFYPFVDPWRKPWALFSTLFSPIGTLADKLRVATLRRRVRNLDDADLSNRTQQSTLEFLQAQRFSSSIIERFFRPFFGGVFLESDLSTSSVKFEYLFQLFSQGRATLPAGGMQSIAQQLADELPPGSIQLGARVQRITPAGVEFADGRSISGSPIVLATSADVAARLLDHDGSCRFPTPRFLGVKCIYFSADRSPLKSKTLVLNGESIGPVNSLCVPSDICPNYAPEGKSLVSVSVLDSAAEPDEQELMTGVRQQLRSWFGPSTDSWDHLKTFQVQRALPLQTPSEFQPVIKPARHNDQLFLCGDYLGVSSIQGAMKSGRLAAESILENIR